VKRGPSLLIAGAVLAGCGAAPSHTAQTSPPAVTEPAARQSAPSSPATASASQTTASRATSTTTTTNPVPRRHRGVSRRRRSARAVSQPTTRRLPASPPASLLEIAGCERTVSQMGSGALTVDERSALDRWCVLEFTGTPGQAAVAQHQICVTVAADSGLAAAAAKAAKQSCPAA
jgi:hypothetical protein